MTTTTTPPTTADVDAAVQELRRLVQGDGADLRFVAFDPDARCIELALDLEDASCADCVLPPARLHDVLLASLAQHGVTGHRLVVHDPRVAATPDSGATIVVLDPTGEVDRADRDPGPDAGPLAGRTVGVRVDVLWTSWDRVVDEWTSMFEAAGVTVRTWRRTQGLAGADGKAADASFDDFLADVDAVVVGLGNCGSCTSWTIRDAVTARAADRPTTAVVTAQFLPLGEMLSVHYGRPGLRLHVLPYPLQTRPDDEVRAIAREAFPALLATLGATV